MTRLELRVQEERSNNLAPEHWVTKETCTKCVNELFLWTCVGVACDLSVACLTAKALFLSLWLEGSHANRFGSSCYPPV